MYSRAEKPEGVTFEVEPSRSHWPWQAALALFLAGGACLPPLAGSCASSCVHGGDSLATVLTLAFAVALFWCLPTWYRRSILDKHRERTSFSVSPAGVTLCGQLFPVADIHRITVRNHLIRDWESDMVVVGGSFGEQMTAGSVNMGNALRRSFSKNCFRVDVEARGIPHTVAGGLLESEAFAVASEVSKALRGVPVVHA